MKIPNFRLFRELTKPEIDYLLENCNFTEDEEIYFLKRTKDHSNASIAIELNCSEAQVSKLAKRVKDKIKRVV